MYDGILDEGILNFKKYLKGHCSFDRKDDFKIDRKKSEFYFVKELFDEFVYCYELISKKLNWY